MKKLTTILIAIVAFGFSAYSQNGQDALRFSQNYYGTTARSMALGGAFGALGADFAAVSINPAGVGVYRKSEFTLSPSFGNNTSMSSFQGSKLEDFNYDFGLGNMGLIGAFSTGNESGWKSVNIGFGYNKLNDFDRITAIKSVNQTSSMLDQYVADANGGYMPNATDLAIRTGLVYQINGEGDWMNDFAGSDYGQLQRHSVDESGSIGEYVFTTGANYNDMIYIGGSVNVSSIRYRQQTTHEELEVPEDISYLNSFTYQQDLEISGSGVNFKGGVILKPVSWLRLGAAVHSPTFYSLHDSYTSRMEADLTIDTESPQTASGEYDYELYTPPKLIGSAAVILAKFALISFDYERIDYAKSKLRGGGDGYTFSAENEDIQLMYKMANNYRLGTELRFGALSVRGGYAYYDSPYETNQLNADADYQAVSAGFGINNNSFYIDFGFSHYFGTEEYVLYQSPFASSSNEIANNKLLCTVGFRF